MLTYISLGASEPTERMRGNRRRRQGAVANCRRRFLSKSRPSVNSKPSKDHEVMAVTDDCENRQGVSPNMSDMNAAAEKIGDSAQREAGVPPDTTVIAVIDIDNSISPQLISNPPLATSLDVQHFAPDGYCVAVKRTRRRSIHRRTAT